MEERPGPPPPWSAAGRRHKEKGKGGSGKGAPQPRKAGDFHEAYANNGYYNMAGGSATYQEIRSGSRTEAGRQPSTQALEWLEVQARHRSFHKFKQAWHYPKDWPSNYYDHGEPYCPPPVDGKAREYFQGARGLIFNFLELGFKYLGQNEKHPCKQQWEPYPYPTRSTRGKGSQKGKSARKQPRDDDAGDEGEKKAGEEVEGAARGWFT